MKRRGRSPTVYEGTNTLSDDCMDSDDQTLLVETLEKEAAEAMMRFRYYFVSIGNFAIAASLVLPLLCQEECRSQSLFCWVHSIYSSLLHGMSISLAKKPGNDFSLFVMSFILASIPMIVWLMGRFEYDVEHFHLGLALSNMITLTGCMLLRWDDTVTRKSLKELNELKYSHKSL